MIEIPVEVIPVLRKIIKQDGIPYLVGGAVRDHLLGIKPKDFDFEIFDLESGELIPILQKFGKVELVGKSYGIINLHLENGVYQFSIPRTEVKVSQGRDGFDFVFDPYMDVKTAQARRDYRVGSLYIPIEEYLSGEMIIIDNYDGLKDLEDRVLRHTSEEFVKDSLRVLRGMRFGALGFTMAPETIEFCQKMVYYSEELSNDRIRDEFLGWAKNPYPSMGLSILEQTGWVILFPTLIDMIGVQQEPEWHPEGDVWVHSALTCDAAANIARRLKLNEEDTQVLVMAALLHDCGKPKCTTTSPSGRIVSPNHDVVGAEIAEKFLKTFKFSNNHINRITELVSLHMWHIHNSVTNKSIRKLLAKLQYNSLEMLLAIMEADHSARPPLTPGLPEKMKDAAEIAEKEKGKVKPIILGRHIIELGYPPNQKFFGDVLRVIYNKQLEGEFETEGQGKELLKIMLDSLAIFPYEKL